MNAHLSFNKFHFKKNKKNKGAKIKSLILQDHQQVLWAARDSNPQRRQPTDLQSAPALQLRRPPKIRNEQQIYF